MSVVNFYYNFVHTCMIKNGSKALCRQIYLWLKLDKLEVLYVHNVYSTDDVFGEGVRHCQSYAASFC